MASNDKIHEHGVLLEGYRDKVRCRYCDKIMSSGFYRLRHHLAGIRGGDVTDCKNVPAHVKDACLNVIFEKLSTKISKEVEELHGSKVPLKKMRMLSQASTSGTKLESLSENNEDLFAGCSILLVACEDPFNRTLLNVLVHTPKETVPLPLRTFNISGLDGNVNEMVDIVDKVVAEVGVKNTTQFITYSTTAYMKKVGMSVMAKHPTIFWTVSASHCFQLMLERILSLNSFKNTLDKGKILTKSLYYDDSVPELAKDNGSITKYLTLKDIVNEEQLVKTFFNSLAWTNSTWADTTKGKELSDIAADLSFWNVAKMVINAAMPIVKALQFLKEKNTAKIGFIYGKVNQVKEEIKENFENKKSHYLPVWKAIDEIWIADLHSPLHSAGYFLNPCFFYARSFFCDENVISGLFECVAKMAKNEESANLIIQQLDQYKMKKGNFKEGSSPANRCRLTPETWWLTYGGQCAELQQIAARILSQTCNGV